MPVLTESALSIKLPEMIKVRQKFGIQRINDIESAVSNEIYNNTIVKMVKPGQKIAIAVGSRGIFNLAEIVKTVGNCLKRLGAKPFIVPAMGSHGGGTAEGQREVLSSYGINENRIGLPIVSSMEVLKVGETVDKIPVLMDRVAYESDMIVPIARIKPHTDYKARIESGLCKMMAIGLGKHEGCSRLHKEGFERFGKVIPEVAEVIIKETPIGFGIAIIENAYDRTAFIKAVIADEILNEEPGMLNVAKSMMPKIMLPDIDVLIVEQIGKDISGAGMDPNIIGRTTKGKLQGFEGPDIKRIIVLSLSENTHGNACGIGLADFTVKHFLESVNYTSTYANVIASGNPEAGRIPIVMENETEAVIAALSCCPGINENNPKIVRIKNTLHVEEIFISKNMMPDIEGNALFEIVG